MNYDSFIEIEDENGMFKHYFWDSKAKKSGRVLNINEDYFLRLVWKTKAYNFDFINHLFNLMEDAPEEQWLRVLSGAKMFIDEEKL